MVSLPLVATISATTRTDRNRGWALSHCETSRRHQQKDSCRILRRSQ